MTSKTPSGPSLIHVPNLFSVVEQGVYRCASPTPAQVPFLNSLNLKTIVSLTPEHPIKPLLQFSRSTGVDFIHLGLQLWRPFGTEWKPVRDEVLKITLEKYILDTRAHPLLLIDPIGVHQTGCVVGALRMMQGWNFASVLVEYRSHAGSKHRYTDEQYIELFDPEYINLPSEQHRPSWWISSFDESDSDGGYKPDTDIEPQPCPEKKLGSTTGQEGTDAKGLAQETVADNGSSDPAVEREVDGIVPGHEEPREPPIRGEGVEAGVQDESKYKTIGNKLEGG